MAGVVRRIVRIIEVIAEAGNARRPTGTSSMLVFDDRDSVTIVGGFSLSNHQIYIKYP